MQILLRTHSRYPSESFMVEAASRQMHHYHTTRPSFIVAEILKRKLDHGVIDFGRKGGMVMHLMLRKAYMDAIVAKQGDTDPNVSQGCSSLRFFKALFADPFHNMILGS